MRFSSKVGPMVADEILKQDEVVNELLIESGFEGRISEAILAKLWTYGHKNITALIRTGEIFNKCAALGRPVTRSVHWSFASQETLTELADETVIAGLSLFKSQILSRCW